MTKVNKFYEAPSTTVVELKTQGIICVSGNVNATMAPSTTVVELKTQGIICVSGNVNATMDGVFTEETILP